MGEGRTRGIREREIGSCGFQAPAGGRRPTSSRVKQIVGEKEARDEDGRERTEETERRGWFFGQAARNRAGGQQERRSGGPLRALQRPPSESSKLARAIVNTLRSSSSDAFTRVTSPQQSITGQAFSLEIAPRKQPQHCLTTIEYPRD